MTQLLTEVATVEREHPGGTFTDFDVVDTRSGETLAVRGRATAAGEIVDALNRRYPASPWPAQDTLVHEIVGLRIAGEVG